MNSAIIIFVRNPEAGNIKTRLAATVGEVAAFKVYQLLLQHTYNSVKFIDCDKYVFYADWIDADDLWKGNNLFKKQQSGADLGIRMKNAFNEVLNIGYKNVIIIGSDCYELSPEIIMESLLLLLNNDVVIGPALDGGYYLLGMKKLYGSLFENKSWSSPTVLKDTLDDVIREGLTYSLLTVLNDVDEEKDITFSY